MELTLHAFVCSRISLPVAAVSAACIASVRHYCTFIQYYGSCPVFDEKQHDDAARSQN